MNQLTSDPDAKNIVVMIHGAGGGGWEFDRWKTVFERNLWRVIASDLMPAQSGLSATNYSDYVEQVNQWVRIERSRLVLVGASLGGLLALDVSHNLKADAVILVNSALPAGVGNRRNSSVYPAIIRWADGPIGETSDALPDGDELTIRWAASRWRDESGSVLNAVNAGIHVEKPDCPVLVILGGKDKEVPLDLGIALALWANADIHMYAKASHVGPLLGLRAYEIAEAAIQWLKARIMT